MVIVLAIALGSVILLSGLFTEAADPLFQRALLRFLAILGFIAVLGMSLALVAGTGRDELVEEPVRRRRR